MKRSFTNFINYLKLKEKETLKILDNSYHANLKEFQDSSKNCKMFTGRFKFIAENIRELIKFQSEDEKQYFINHKLSFIQKEIDSCDIVTEETVQAITDSFFEENEKVLKN